MKGKVSSSVILYPMVMIKHNQANGTIIECKSREHNWMQSNFIEYQLNALELKNWSTIGLRFSWVWQSNFNQSIAFDWINLWSSLIEIVWTYRWVIIDDDVFQRRAILPLLDGGKNSITKRTLSKKRYKKWLFLHHSNIDLYLSP